ncbi:33 kDa chaperonin [Striga asiatica]|uniref:33 kDa chaperonin n=1 Tax=Striga asiatica TaxID=4170 RepID=A0A5A7RK34_STRAF|nr:33 kDa chaperonin [Striga asiatica]
MQSKIDRRKRQARLESFSAVATVNSEGSNPAANISIQSNPQQDKRGYDHQSGRGRTQSQRQIANFQIQTRLLSFVHQSLLRLSPAPPPEIALNLAGRTNLKGRKPETA